MSESVVNGGNAVLGSAFTEAMAEGEVEEIEFASGCGGFAEIVAKVGSGTAPEVFQRGFAVGEDVGVVGEEGNGATGVEEDADEFGEVDDVDLLMMGVEAEEDSGR